MLYIDPNMLKKQLSTHRWASSFVLEGGHEKFDWGGGGGHKKISAPVRGCSKFPKITNFYAKIAWFWRNFFFGGQIFKKKNSKNCFFFLKKNVVSQKSKIQRGGQKAFLEGVG